MHAQALIQALRKEAHTQQADLWSRIAYDLEQPTRQRRVVNISSISRYTKPNEVVVVPGKVLGSGNLSHSVVVAAFSFSSSAKERIEQAKGKCMSIPELVKQNPKGKNIRIIG